MEKRTSESFGVGSEVAERAEQLSQQAMAQIEDIRDRASELGDRAIAFMKERPGTSLLIAAGAGYLLGRIVRS